MKTILSWQKLVRIKETNDHANGQQISPISTYNSVKFFSVGAIFHCCFPPLLWLLELNWLFLTLYTHFLLVNIVFLWAELAGGRKSSLTASITLAVKFFSLFFLFYNNWRNSDFTCICKVTHSPEPRLLFENVNFYGRNQIGQSVQAFTQRMDDLTGFPSVEWLTSKVYSRDKFTVYLVMKMYIYISMWAGNYFYSYIIIPATINPNNIQYIQ